MGGATSGPRRTRRRWSEEEKKAIVAESSHPDTSIAAVARLHDLNANQLQSWRRQYNSADASPPTSEPPFLAVDIAKGAPVEQPAEDASKRRRLCDRRQGLIEIELPCGARLCCDQHVDRRTLTLVVDILMARP